MDNAISRVAFASENNGKFNIISFYLMNTTNYFATIQKSRIKKFSLTHHHGFQKKIFQIFTNVKILVKLQDQIVPLVKIPNISSVRSSVRKIYSS